MGYFFSRHLERPPKPARSYLQDLNFHDPLNGMIGRIYGVEPVQAVGSIRGTPFYFKSKDETWNFSVANDIAMDPSDIKSPEQGFYLEGKFENANEGNFLELQAAKRLIEKCIAQYLEKHWVTGSAFDEKLELHGTTDDTNSLVKLDLYQCDLFFLKSQWYLLSNQVSKW